MGFWDRFKKKDNTDISKVQDSAEDTLSKETQSSSENAAEENTTEEILTEVIAADVNPTDNPSASEIIAEENTVDGLPVENQVDDGTGETGDATETATLVESEAPKEEKKAGFFARLKAGLKKTRDNIVSSFDSLFSASEKIDDDFYEELEEILVTGDCGIRATEEILDELKSRVKKDHIKNPSECKQILIDSMKAKMDMGEITYAYEKEPAIIFVIGVNGVGKTTSIGKLASQLKSMGKKVTLAGADTFRAAAGDQLKMWADRVGVEMIGGKEGADPASVLYDAVAAAKARKSDVLIVDTAGRLHNKKNLMEELKKMNRVLDREYPGILRENFIVLDGTTGQNALVQAREFKEAADLTGIILTKMDGTAKGGIAIAVTSELGIPVKYIGVGEKVEDLQKFDSDAFIDALFDVDVHENMEEG